jgi:hypothetical protein
MKLRRRAVAGELQADMFLADFELARCSLLAAQSCPVKYAQSNSSPQKV